MVPLHITPINPTYFGSRISFIYPPKYVVFIGYVSRGPVEVEKSWGRGSSVSFVPRVPLSRKGPHMVI